jgi:hypothetical protein
VDVELLTDADYMPPTAVQAPILQGSRADVLRYVLADPQPAQYTFVVAWQITLSLSISRP